MTQSPFEIGLPVSSLNRAYWYALPLWIAYAALAPVAVYSFVNLVVVLIVGALGVHGAQGLKRTIARSTSDTSPELLIVAGIWLLLCCIWSVNISDAFSTLAKLALIALACLGLWSAISSLSYAHSRVLQSIIVMTGVLLIVIYAIEILLGAPISSVVKEIHSADLSTKLPPETRARLLEERAHLKIARGVVALGALSFAMSFIIWRRLKSPGLAAGLWLTCLAVAFASHMTSVPVALLLAALSMIWVWVLPKNGLLHVATAATLFALVFPLIAYHIDAPERFGIDSAWLDTSSQHRVQIYHYTAQLIADRPLTGWGFRAARNLSDHAPSFIAAGHTQPFNAKQTILPLHPHNMSLQLWLETGFVGVLLFFGMLILGALRICRSRLVKGQRMMVAGTATFLFVVANLSFGVWQFHWISLIALAAGAVLVCSHRPRRTV